MIKHYKLHNYQTSLKGFRYKRDALKFLKYLKYKYLVKRYD